MLGRVHALDGWHRTDRFPDAEETDGVIVYRWEAPLFFANTGIFRQEVRALVHRRRPRWVILQCEAITDIDVTAATCSTTSKGVEREGHQRRVGRDAHPDRISLERYRLFATFTREHVYPSIDVVLAGSRKRSEQARAVDATSSADELDDTARGIAGRSQPLNRDGRPRTTCQRSRRLSRHPIERAAGE